MQNLQIHDAQLTELAFSVQNIINNSLAVLELKVEESRDSILPHIPEPEREQVLIQFEEMKQEQMLIYSAFNTLFNMVKDSKHVGQRGKGEFTRQPEEILLEHLRSRLEHHEA